MALPAWVGTIFKPLTDMVEGMHTSQEERGAIRLSLLEAQIGMAQKVLDYEIALADFQSRVIIAEAQGESWLQRNWRPAIMMIFGVVVAWNFIVADVVTWLMTIFTPGTLLPPRLEIPEPMWTLLTVGIGGYIASRSFEKVASTLAAKGISFGKKEDE